MNRLETLWNRSISEKYLHTFKLLRMYDENSPDELVETKDPKLMDLTNTRNSLGYFKAFLNTADSVQNNAFLERNNMLESIWGALEQTFDGIPLYNSVEEIAAHLLYMIVKNHPFNDGNKRSAAFLFVKFLEFNGKYIQIDSTALACLILLIAQSRPEQKDDMIYFIRQILSK